MVSTSEDGRQGPVSLDGMYPGGLLIEGRVIQDTDDVVVCEPHLVTVEEINNRLGGTPARDRLLEHLTGFHALFSDAAVGDPRAELWIRGNLASTLDQSADELDLVAIYGPSVGEGNLWLLRQLLSSPVALPPYSMNVTGLRHDGIEHAFDKAREARRSRVRARDHNKEPFETGWLSAILHKGETR